MKRACKARGTPQPIGHEVGRTISDGGSTKLEQRSKNLFHHKNNLLSGMTHGDDFVVTGPTSKLIELKKKVEGVCPIKHRARHFWFGDSEAPILWVRSRLQSALEQARSTGKVWGKDLKMLVARPARLPR